MFSTVIGNSPIGFTDAANGSQRFIPLSSLYFENGVIQAKNWSLYAANQKIVDALLGELLKAGFLVPGTTPPAKPAMVIESAILGAKGNSIQVAFSNVVVDASIPANTTFDAIITAKNTYPELSFNAGAAASIKTVLGTETLPGTSPSLIRAKDAEPPKQPKNGSYPLTSGAAIVKANVAITDAANLPAFTVEAWKNGADGNNILVTVSAVNAIAQTFTLVVEWKEQKITGIKLADLPDKLVGNGLLLKVSQPADGAFAIPAIGSITLTGGTDAQAASTATATVVAQS